MIFTGLDGTKAPHELQDKQLVLADNCRPYKGQRGLLGPRLGQKFINTTEQSNDILALLSYQAPDGTIKFFDMDDNGGVSEDSSIAIPRIVSEIELLGPEREYIGGTTASIGSASSSDVTVTVNFSKSYPVERYSSIVFYGRNGKYDCSGGGFFSLVNFRGTLSVLVDGAAGNNSITWNLTGINFSNENRTFNDPDWAEREVDVDADEGESITGIQIRYLLASGVASTWSSDLNYLYAIVMPR